MNHDEETAIAPDHVHIEKVNFGSLEDELNTYEAVKMPGCTNSG